jgi:hypothetical protein
LTSRGIVDNTTQYTFSLDSEFGGISVNAQVAIDLEDSPLTETQIAELIYNTLAAQVGETFTGVRAVREFRSSETFPKENA